jgi:putative transposase
VHLLRNSMRYVSYGDRKLIAKALRPIYTAVNADAALTEFTRVHGRHYPGIVTAWQRACSRRRTVLGSGSNSLCRRK